MFLSTFEKNKKKNNHVPFLFHPFIHPPPYQDPGSSGSTLIRAAQASFSRATSSERLLGHPEAFPDQLEYYNPSESSGLPPSQTCPEYLHGEASGRHPNQMPCTTSAGSVQHKGVTVARLRLELR